MHKLIILSFSLILSFAFTTEVRSQQATDEQVYELLEVMNTEEQFIFGIEMTMKMQEEAGQLAMLPEGFQAEYIKEAKLGFKDDLLPTMMKIYQNNLSADEIADLTTFYRSDIGKLLIEKLPTIQSEAANAGMIWGQQLGMKIMGRLNKE